MIDERIAKLEALLARVLARKREEANGNASYETRARAIHETNGHEAKGRGAHDANGRGAHGANGHEANGRDMHERNGRDPGAHEADDADDFLSSFDTSIAAPATGANVPSPLPSANLPSPFPSAKLPSPFPSAKLPSSVSFAPLPTPNNAFFPLGAPRTPPPVAPDRPSATPAKPPAPSSTIAPPDASIDQTLADAAAAPGLLRRVPRAEPSSVRAVEPPPGPMEVIELDIDPDPSMAPPVSNAHEEPLESKSRLVSAPPALDQEPLEEDEDDEDDLLSRQPPSDPTIEVSNVELGQADLAAFDEEPAPTSSRRPISIEAKMSELDDAPPLHPAPPKSGPLPAASPSMELELDIGSTGVHRLQGTLEAERAAGLLERAPHAEKADKAEAPSAEIAVFIGAPPASLAGTFGEILDEALRL